MTKCPENIAISLVTHMISIYRKQEAQLSQTDRSTLRVIEHYC